MNEPSSDTLLDDAESQIAQALSTDDNFIVDDPEATVSPEDDISIDDSVESEEDDVVTSVESEDQAEIDRARAQGWRPEGEYKGPKGKWKDFKEFNAVGDKIATKLSSKIDYLSDRNKKQEDMIKQLIRSQGEVAKQAQSDALEALKDQRREAIEQRDIDAVDVIDERIKSVKDQKIVEVDEEDTDEPQQDPEVHEFIQAEKSWFNNANPDMVQFACQMESLERQMDPSGTSADVMARVRDAVVQRFPGRISDNNAPAKPKRAKQLKHSSVEGGVISVPNGGVRKFSELPAEARKIAETFERDGIMSRKDYMKQYNEGLS